MEQSLDLTYDATRAKLDETHARQLAKLNENNANHMGKIEQYKNFTKAALKKVQRFQKKSRYPVSQPFLESSDRYLGKNTATVDAQEVLDSLNDQRGAVLGHLADKLGDLKAVPENQAKLVSFSKEKSYHLFCFRSVQEKRDVAQMGGGDGDAEDSDRTNRNRGK